MPLKNEGVIYRIGIKSKVFYYYTCLSINTILQAYLYLIKYNNIPPSHFILIMYKKTGLFKAPKKHTPFSAKLLPD